MPLRPSRLLERTAAAHSGFAGSLLIAVGVALLILSSALFLGQGPVAGSGQPPVAASDIPQAGDAVVLLGARGPAFQSADTRLVRLEQAPVVPTAVAQPPLAIAGQLAAEPVMVPPSTPTPSRPNTVVAPTQPTLAPTPAPVLPVDPPTPAPPPTEAPPPPPPPAQPVSLTGFEADILAGVNNERVAAGLSPLQLDGALVAVARERSNDMVAQGYFGHTSPSGETAFSLMDKYGVPYSWAGENLARNNYPDAESVAIAMRDWMASPGHRDNMLNVHYTAVGVGSAVDASGMKYFTVVFTGQ